MTFTIGNKRGHKTRCGYSARILATDLKSDYPIAAAVMNDHGNENVYMYTMDGKLSKNGPPYQMDLVDVEAERRVRYYPLMMGNNFFVSTVGFPTLDRLLNTAPSIFVADVWGVVAIISEDDEVVDVQHVANAEDTAHLRRKL